MFSFEWINWLGESLKTIGDLIPRHILIEPSEIGIKFQDMKKIVLLTYGRHWYIPYFSKVRIESSVKQTLYLGNQIVLTSDGTCVKIESSILFQVVDFISVVTKFNCYMTQIDDDARNVLCRYFSTINYKESVIGNTNKINEDLTKMVGDILKEYGILTYRIQIMSIASGFPLLHIDNKLNV